MIKAVDQFCDTIDFHSSFLQRNIAKEIYGYTANIYDNNNMISELKIITTVLLHPMQYSLETPIAHIVTRDPDFVTYGNACLEATGGFFDGLKF